MGLIIRLKIDSGLCWLYARNWVASLKHVSKKMIDMHEDGMWALSASMYGVMVFVDGE